MIPQPATVKIVVPIPPVDGRATSLVSSNLVEAVNTAVASFAVNANVASAPSSLITEMFIFAFKNRINLSKYQTNG